LRISLVNPPFANYQRPSIGLTQLRSSIRGALPDAVVDIHYLNLDFVGLLGTNWYTDISDGHQSWTGLGDWLFRPMAFPDAPNNSTEYLQWLGRPDAGWFPDNHAPLQNDPSKTLLHFQKVVCDALPNLIARRRLETYDVIGVTSMFSQTLCALAILRLVKKLQPSIVTVLGGANCESPMGDAIVEKFDFVDRVFSGRSTVSFPQFLQSLQKIGSLDKIPTIPGVLRRNPQAPSIQDQFVPLQVSGREMVQKNASQNGVTGPTDISDHLPQGLALDYDDFVTDLASAPFASNVVIPFETSTGCWWGQKSHCTFCGLNSNSMKFRALDANDAVELIHSLVQRYSHVCHVFEAVDNILSDKYFTDVLPRLRLPTHVSLFYEVKANLTERHVQQMASARICRIQPGIESLSTDALRLLRKGVDAVRNVTLLRNCMSHGISVDWNVLVAIPGETLSIYDHMLREAPKLVHLEPPAGAFEIRFDRYSPYFNRPDEFALDIVPYRFYSFLYPFPDDWISRVAYYFDSVEGRGPGEEVRGRIAQVRALIGQWRRRWHCPSRPLLEFVTEAEPTVIDTRDQDHPYKCVLDEAQALALQFLREPRGRDQVRQFLEERQISSKNAEDSLAFIRTNGWTFDEGTRIVSLVVDRRLSAASPADH
jgi:ribosomal peptide maturation radical SAM protein 1